MELLKQVHEVHASARPDIFPGQSKYTEEQVKEILTNPALPVIVAREGGKTWAIAFANFLPPVLRNT